MPTQFKQTRKINEVGNNYFSSSQSTSSKFSSQNIYQPNQNGYCLFVPPPVFTVGSEYLIFSKEGLCSLFPCNLFNDDGILLRTKDGEIGFLSLIDRIISENSLFVPFNDIEDTKNATCFLNDILYNIFVL